VSWTPPTSTEIGTVAKSGLAAGLSWWIAVAVTDVPDPVLGPLTAIVVVQVSVRASVRTALQRSAAVVLGVLLALAIGDALYLNGLTVAVLVAVSLGVAQLVLRLPPSAARQVPISGLVVLSAVTASPGTSGWQRGLDTVIGAVVGSWSRWGCRRLGWSTPVKPWRGWRMASVPSSGQWIPGYSKAGPRSRPRTGGAARARCASASSTKRTRQWATAGMRLAGTSAIGAMSTSSVATRT
jgi:Fusaric acid resistance protein-like